MLLCCCEEEHGHYDVIAVDVPSDEGCQQPVWMKQEEAQHSALAIFKKSGTCESLGGWADYVESPYALSDQLMIRPPPGAAHNHCDQLEIERLPDAAFDQWPDEAANDMLCTFKVSIWLQKNQDFGLLLDAPGGPYLRIVRIDAQSPFAELNKHCKSQEEHVRVGDFLLAVNDVFGGGVDLCLELCSGGDMEMTLCRAVEITVRDLDKTNMTIGLDLSFRSESHSVVVRQIFADGAIAKWNRTAPPELQVCENDHIVAVNQRRGNCEQLMQAMRDSRKPTLVIARPVATPRAL